MIKDWNTKELSYKIQWDLDSDKYERDTHKIFRPTASMLPLRIWTLLNITACACMGILIVYGLEAAIVSSAILMDKFCAPSILRVLCSFRAGALNEGRSPLGVTNKFRCIRVHVESVDYAQRRLFEILGEFVGGAGYRSYTGSRDATIWIRD